MFVQVINGYNVTNNDTQYKIMCRIYKHIKTTYLVRFYDIIENILYNNKVYILYNI